MYSFRQWERENPLNSIQPQQDKIEDEASAAIASNNQDKQNETSAAIWNLCRVCSSSGLINIKSPIPRISLKLWPPGDARKWEKPINEILAAISGEEVRKFGRNYDIEYSLLSVSSRFLSTTTCLSIFVSIAYHTFNTRMNSE